MAAGTPKQINELLHKFFGGLPIIEGKGRLLINAKSIDKEGAKRNDPLNCFLSRAYNRLFDATAVVFLRTKAYLDLPIGGGKCAVHRFNQPAKTRASIASFDETGEIDPDGYWLVAPLPSQTLEQNRKYSRNTKKHRQAARGASKKPTRSKVMASGSSKAAGQDTTPHSRRPRPMKASIALGITKRKATLAEKSFIRNGSGFFLKQGRPS